MSKWRSLKRAPGKILPVNKALPPTPNQARLG
jgi:hypothetical protein